MYLLPMFSDSELVAGKETIPTHSLQHSGIVVQNPHDVILNVG